jgi:hypothetical protein
MRWLGMRRWFAIRLAEGSDLDQEVELEWGDYSEEDEI